MRQAIDEEMERICRVARELAERLERFTAKPGETAVANLLMLSLIAAHTHLEDDPGVKSQEPDDSPTVDYDDEEDCEACWPEWRALLSFAGSSAAHVADSAIEQGQLDIADDALLTAKAALEALESVDQNELLHGYNPEEDM